MTTDQTLQTISNLINSCIARANKARAAGSQDWLLWNDLICDLQLARRGVEVQDWRDVGNTIDCATSALMDDWSWRV